MSDDLLRGFIEHIQNDEGKSNGHDQSSDPQIKVKLTELLKIFSEKQRFKRGDVICYKKGFQHKKIIGPYIVIKKLWKPLIDIEDGPSSPHYMEPLDIKVGTIIRGRFITFHLDSRRMELFEYEG